MLVYQRVHPINLWVKIRPIRPEAVPDVSSVPLEKPTGSERVRGLFGAEGLGVEL